MGSAQRESDGSKFWSYEDELRTTSKQTVSEASPYSGNAARQGDAMMNRMQFTGIEVEMPN